MVDDDIVAGSGNFVVDTVLDGQPVEVRQQRRNMLAFWCFENKTGGTVHDLLDFVEKILRKTSKERVAVVQSRENE